MLAITQVKGVGSTTVALLAEHGITTISQLATAKIDYLMTIQGIGRARAKTLLKEASTLLNEANEIGATINPSVIEQPANNDPAPLTFGSAESKPEKVKVKKDKKDKKGKKAKGKKEKEKKKDKKDKKAKKNKKAQTAE